MAHEPATQQAHPAAGASLTLVGNAASVPAATPHAPKPNPTRTYGPVQHARRVAWGKRFGAANRANWLRELRLHP